MIECNDNIKVGVLFDLDGVLIDSEREYTRIWSEIDRRYPTGVENFAIKIKGQTLPEILSNHYPETLHSAVIDMLNEQEQQMRSEVQKLIRLRRTSMPLLYGDMQTENLTEDEWTYTRTYMGKKVRVTINRKEMSYTIEN